MSPINPRLLRPTRKSPSGPTDPLFSQVKMLLHFDGGFTNSASSGIVVSPQGGASISSSVKKFGSGAAAFDGDGDYLTADVSTIPSFGTTPFTIEMWAYVDGAAGTCVLFSRHGGVASWGDATSGLNMNLYYDAGTLTCEYQSTEGSAAMQASGVPADAWVHIAVSLSGGTARLFVNGVLESFSIEPFEPVESADTLEIGRQIDGLDLLGYIDEFRVTAGATAGRYMANFTPPTAAFPNF